MLREKGVAITMCFIPQAMLFCLDMEATMKGGCRLKNKVSVRVKSTGQQVKIMCENEETEPATVEVLTSDSSNSGTLYSTYDKL